MRPYLDSQPTWNSIYLWPFFSLLFVFAVLILTLSASDIYAQDVLGNKGQKTGNATKITAQKMRYQKGKNLVTFLGDVHVDRENFELWSEQLTIYLSKEMKSASKKDSSIKGATGASQFDKIVAQDNVRLKKGEYEATSSKATYEKNKEVIVLEGDVLIKENKNRIKGDKVNFYLNENRSEVLSSPKRQVEAVFYSNSQNEQE